MGTVVLLETYHSGWRARAARRELLISPLETGFMSVKLDEPASEIEFSFEPRALRTGAAVTALGALLAAALCMVRRRLS